MPDSSAGIADKGSVVGSERERCGCNGCGARESQPLFTARDHLTGEMFVVVRCPGCGLCYVNPRPRADQISRYYSEAYFGKRHPFLRNFVTDLRVRKLPHLAGPRRLLDIGCGHGDFMLRCRRRGWMVAGIEQSHSPVMALKESLGIEIYEPADLITLPSEHFDVVTLWHVLEHLPDPAGVLAQVRRVLKPGGLVLIEVPNFGGWEGRLGGPTWFHLDVPRHLYHFEKRPLAALLQQQNFQPRRWQTFSLEYDAFGLAQTLLNRVCSRPNHLFQILIRRGTSKRGSFRDTVLGLMLFPLLLTLAGMVSVLAAVWGEGGVLRVWAEKPAEAQKMAWANP